MDFDVECAADDDAVGDRTDPACHSTLAHADEMPQPSYESSKQPDCASAENSCHRTRELRR
jgi:hypothetical protein